MMRPRRNLSGHILVEAAFVQCQTKLLQDTMDLQVVSSIFHTTKVRMKFSDVECREFVRKSSGIEVWFDRPDVEHQIATVNVITNIVIWAASGT